MKYSNCIRSNLLLVIRRMTWSFAIYRTDCPGITGVFALPPTLWAGTVSLQTQQMKTSVRLAIAEFKNIKPEPPGIPIVA